MAYWSTLPAARMRLRAITRDEGIDIVNLHYPTDQFAPLVHIGRRDPVKLVLSIHGADLFPEGRAPYLRHPGLKALLQAAHLIVAPSQSFLRASEAQYAAITGKGVVIYNGLDTAEFPSVGATASDENGFPNLLCIAALTKKKAQDVLLSALPLVLRVHPDARLVLVGEGPERRVLERQVADLGLAGHVRFAGLEDRANVVRRLQEAHVVVLPSREEPFGLAAIEGMMAMRPVVASAVGGLQEIITNDADGVLVPPDNPAMLATAIVDLLNDAERRARLGAAGRRTVLERFRLEHTGAAYLAHFSALLAAP